MGGAFDLIDGQDAHSGTILIDDHESTRAKLGFELLYRRRDQREKSVRQHILHADLNNAGASSASDRKY